MNIQNSTFFISLSFLTSLLLTTGVFAEEPTVDHNQYFTENSYEGTISCLGAGCHDTEAQDILKTGHWKWQGIADNVVGADGVEHGKKDFINNFCVAVPTNEGRCAQCHIGYGYINDSFDFTEKENIDCLICHDQTGTYAKVKAPGGYPALPLVSDEDPDLQAVAQSVGDNNGVPGRKNCIVCHANAGGGDNVKHGDLAMSLLDTGREYDVHMGADGGNMSCVACHQSDDSHGIGGMPYHSVGEGSMKQCVDCHTDPGDHKGEIKKMVESHDRLACQVCHIPAIARETSTKVEWYWSEAGDLTRVPVLDEDGRPDYNKLKGEFVWASNVRPTLRFHNGKWNKTMVNVNDSFQKQPVDLGSPAADRSDVDAMIYPFKKMIGNQVTDTRYKTVLVPHLWGTVTGENPYWGEYDWDLALEDGAEYTGQIYSGKFKFVNTEMLLAVNHEIAPKEQALGYGGDCMDCHTQRQIDWRALGWNKDPYNGKGQGGGGQGQGDQ